MYYREFFPCVKDTRYHQLTEADCLRKPCPLIGIEVLESHATVWGSGAELESNQNSKKRILR